MPPFIIQTKTFKIDGCQNTHRGISHMLTTFGVTGCPPAASAPRQRFPLLHPLSSQTHSPPSSVTPPLTEGAADETSLVATGEQNSCMPTQRPGRCFCGPVGPAPNTRKHEPRHNIPLYFLSLSGSTLCQLSLFCRLHTSTSISLSISE